MSLGLKEVLSTNTDFVSRKDESLEEIYQNSTYYGKLTELFKAEDIKITKDWTFSGSKKNEEIEKVAEALLKGELVAASISESEQLSKRSTNNFF